MGGDEEAAQEAFGMRTDEVTHPLKTAKGGAAPEKAATRLH
jgi:hypothetical protein